MLFKRINGAWTELGSSYASGVLPAGTQLTLTAAGDTLTFSGNGVAQITATDANLTGGAHGIMANGTPTAANWSGGSVVGTTLRSAAPSQGSGGGWSSKTTGATT